MIRKKLLAQLLDGSLNDHRWYLEGRYKGYYIVVNQNANMQMLTISACSEEDPGNARLDTLVQNIKTGRKQILNADTTSSSVTVSVRSLTEKSFVKLMNEVVPEIVRFLTEGGYTSGCSQCGSTEEVECYNINGRNMFVCRDCLASIEDELIRNQDEKKTQRSKFIPGLLGALLGVLFGGILYVLVMQLGYVASICGLVMAFLTLFLYEKFGGCLDAKGIICCIALLAAMVFFATKLSWAWSFYDVYKDPSFGPLTFGECFAYFRDLLDLNDLGGSFTSDLLMGYFFTAIGSVGKFINAFRSSSGKFSIKKSR